MLSAGQRNERLRFERRAPANPDAPDDLGNVLAEWVSLGEAWGAYHAPRGAEPVESGRPASQVLARLTVLRNAMTAGVTAADRAVFLAGPRAGLIANIRAVVPRPDGAEIEFTIESGVAT